jgi:hypothetical protein
MKRLKISYRPNEGYPNDNKQAPRLYATLDLSRYGVEEKIAGLPVYHSKQEQTAGSVTETYSTCIAGLSLEKGSLGSLEDTIDLYMGALIRYGRLPEYFFRVGDKAWPIYRLPDQLLTRYPGNPVLGAMTIGELRLALADYFKIAGPIRNRKELEILMLSRYDLHLYPPVCSFRAQGMADIPVFPIEKGQDVILSAPVDTTAIDVVCHDGQCILDLHDAVSEYLIKIGKLSRPADLTIRKVSAQTWRHVQTALKPYDRALTYHDDVDGRLARRVVPVYANGQHLLAGKTNRFTRTTLYLAPDIWQLQDRLGRELYSQGKLSSPGYVTVMQAS